MPSFFDSQCSYRLLYCFDLPRQQWSLLNRFRTEQGQGPLTAVPAEGNGNLQTLIYVLVARPRRCLTLSNPVPWQNWMAAHLGYTLWMKTLFRGWPIMVNDTQTRRRRMPTLKLHSNGRLYSNTVIVTLAVDGRAVTFRTVRRDCILFDVAL